MLDLISIGPLVELHVVELPVFPSPGEVVQARYEPISIGCDAPIVAARVARMEHTVRLLSNPIGEQGHERLARWLVHHVVEGARRDGAAGPCRIVGLAEVGTRRRSWFPPVQIGVPDLAALVAHPSRYLYVDWYPEVRPWLPGDELRRAGARRTMWINLAAQLDEATWPARVDPDLVQVSARMSHDDAAALARRVASRTGARHVVVTLGQHGSLLLDVERDEQNTIRLAGDGQSRTAAGALFIGSMLGARLAGATWADAHRRASADAAAFVSGGELARALGVTIELGG